MYRGPLSLAAGAGAAEALTGAAGSFEGALALAIAIGYMDIVGTIGGVSLNQTGREMECMTIVLALYLSFSLARMIRATEDKHQLLDARGEQ